MALVITDTPDAYSSIHGDLVFTVSETTKTADPTTYPNYKFIADVYVNAVLVARIKKVQDPVTGIGIFNIGPVLRNYCAVAFSPSGSALKAQELGSGEFYVSVQVKFGEEYSYTSYYNITVDSARTFFNHYNGRLIGVNTTLSNYANDVASRMPPVAYVTSTQRYSFLSYFPTAGSAVNITVTPNVGTVYATTFTPTAASYMQVLNVSPAVLNILQPGTINAATQYYTVQVGGQSYRYNIICEPMHDIYPVHFLNRLGGFDTKLFSKVSRKRIDITRKDYGRLPYTVDAAGLVSTYNTNGVYNESRSAYSNQYKEKVELNSDLLTDEDYTWLEDLLLSPMVYVEDSAYLVPCVIGENTYEAKKVVNDDLTNLVINIEFGNQLNAQYR